MVLKDVDRALEPKNSCSFGFDVPRLSGLSRTSHPCAQPQHLGPRAADPAGHDPGGCRQHRGLRLHLLHAHVPDQQYGYSEVEGTLLTIPVLATIGPAAPARVHAQRGIGGSCPKAGGDAGPQPAAGPGLAAVREQLRDRTRVTQGAAREADADVTQGRTTAALV